MRIAICDDDHAFIAQVSIMLESWAAGRTDLMVQAFSNGVDLIKSHAAAPFDLILLDVIMPMLNGIEVARDIREADKDVKIVFLTSSTDYAVESYSVKASNYLLKPLDRQALNRCLDEMAKEMEKAGRTVSIRSPWMVHSVSVASIEYLRAHGKRVEVTLVSGAVIDSNEPLHVLKERLGHDEGFAECHRSYLVNVNQIGSFSAEEVVMRSGARIPVSRSFRAGFKEAYFSIIFGKDGD